MGILGALESVLGVSWLSWGRLGAVLGWFGGRLGEVLGEVMGVLRASWGVSALVWNVWSTIFAPK